MPRKPKSSEGPRTKQWKFYATEAFIERTEKRLAEHPDMFSSHGDLGMAAIDFFFEQMERCGFVRDERNFPVFANEAHAQYRSRSTRTPEQPPARDRDKDTPTSQREFKSP